MVPDASISLENDRARAVTRPDSCSCLAESVCGSVVVERASPSSMAASGRWRDVNEYVGGQGEHQGGRRRDRHKGVEFSVEFNLNHTSAPRISRRRAPDLRIKVPGMGSSSVGTTATASSLYSALSSANSSVTSLSVVSGTLTENHTTTTRPGKYRSCIAIFKPKNATLRPRRSFLDRIPDMKTGIKAMFLGTPENHDDRKGLRKVCYSLINLPAEELSKIHSTCSGNLNCAVFKQQPLTLTFKTLGNKQFELILPSIPEAMSSGIESVLAGDAEEQGHGGSFDKFISMLPESCRDISEKACLLGLVPKLLPYGEISANARYVGSCFWMWLCIIDDLTENLTGKDWTEAESNLMGVFAEGTARQDHPNPNNDITRVSIALRSVIDETTLYETATGGYANEYHWRSMFRKAVREVIIGFRAERPLLASTKIDLGDWMRVRIITISVRPFMIIARARLGLDPTLSPFGNPLAEDYEDFVATKKSNKKNLAKVECLLQLIMGLQNDIIGWEKDYKTKTPLNTIQILISSGMDPTKALAKVIAMHNELVERLSKYGDHVWSEVPQHPPLTPLPNQYYYASPATATTNGGVSGGGAGGGLRVFGNNPSPRGSAFSLSLKADNRDSLLSTRRPEPPSNDNVQKYLELVIGFSTGMANWMVDSKRYTV